MKNFETVKETFQLTECRLKSVIKTSFIGEKMKRKTLLILCMKIKRILVIIKKAKRKQR